MKIYNSLTKKKEVFTPIKLNQVSMYHCGPTVYDYVHIGNLRSFLLGDIIRRSFEYLGYTTTQVMNITDVGHLVSDGDDGDDKMTKALRREGMEVNLANMLKIADFYADAFKTDLKKLNILTPHHIPKASDHIPENIEIIDTTQNDTTYAFIPEIEKTVVSIFPNPAQDILNIDINIDTNLNHHLDYHY